MRWPPILTRDRVITSSDLRLKDSFCRHSLMLFQLAVRPTPKAQSFRIQTRGMSHARTFSLLLNTFKKQMRTKKTECHSFSFFRSLFFALTFAIENILDFHLSFLTCECVTSVSDLKERHFSFDRSEWTVSSSSTAATTKRTLSSLCVRTQMRRKIRQSEYTRKKAKMKMIRWIIRSFWLPNKSKLTSSSSPSLRLVRRHCRHSRFSLYLCTHFGLRFASINDAYKHTATNSWNRIKSSKRMIISNGRSFVRLEKTGSERRHNELFCID